MRNYYLGRNGRLMRRDNTLYFEREQEEDGRSRIPIPVEDVEALYLYGEIDLNTKLLNFLAQQKIPAHVFNYYGHYAGSYYPRDYLNSGYLLVRQVNYYQSKKKRLELAREFVRAAIHGIQRNIAYYRNRGRDLADIGETIDRLSPLVDDAHDVPSLMGVEGRVRDTYYDAFSVIIGDSFVFEKRVRRPPDNPVNALISFGNSLCYTACLSEIYRTQLNPLISYLHEPGERRYSLALDLAEIFKPLLVDRIIFRLLNQKMLQRKDFDQEANLCFMKESGRRVFLKEWDDRLSTTIKHRRLGRNVSYRHLIRLECYKLIRYLTGMEEYQGFRAWW